MGPLSGPGPFAELVLAGWANVTIAAGHNSAGVLLSAITRANIAELLATGQAPELIRPFAPVSER